MSFLTKSSSFSKDLGLLVLRVGIGLVFLKHGWSKLIGGPQMWETLGAVMGLFGIKFYPVFWGFSVAVIEFFGGLMLTLGLYTRIAAFFMALVMITATTLLISKINPFDSVSHPLSMFVVFVALTITGSGALSIDQLLRKR